jgi:hypothetical protein
MMKGIPSVMKETTDDEKTETHRDQDFVPQARHAVQEAAEGTSDRRPVLVDQRRL